MNAVAGLSRSGRRLFVALLALAALAFVLVSSSATPAATPGLVAAYSFDEGSGTTVTDSSGNGNAGTISAATWTATGKYGGALSFNGTNARINVPNSASLQLTSGMTLEAWVNPATVSSGWRDVIYKGNDNYYLEGTTDHAGVPGGGGTFAGANANAFGSKKLTSNSWSFLATTYDGATLRLYVNGTLAASQATGGAIPSSTSQLQIGGDSIYGQYFKGLIDQVRIYNTPLSATQLQADMTTPVGGGPTDTAPPSTPAGLAVSGVTQTGMTLSWNASSDNVGVTGYRLYLNGSQVGTSLTTSYLFAGLSCGTSSTLGVAAVDAANNVSGIATVGQQTAACPDTQPPSAPGTLSASAASASEIDLSWAAASDNIGVTGYQVFRCQGSGCASFAQVGTASGTSFNDTGLAAVTSYSYQVRAVDTAGNQGPFSNTASATTQAQPDTAPPSTPAGLAVSGVTQTGMTLSWNASSDNVGVTGYRLYLNGSQVGTSLTTSYLFAGLSCGTSSTLGVAAVDAANNVSGIATVGQQTAACPDTQPPSAPGTLSASAASASEIDLSWAAASDNIAVTGYHIERCQGAGCNNFTEIGTSATTGYIDSSAAAGTSYSYRVRANDAAGNLGPYSNIATATTPAPATYSIGGTVSGLSGTVVLQNNGGNDLSVNSAGPFTFSTLLANGAAYSVTVKTNPSGQTCTASNASGTVTSANVTNIAVACTANSTTGGADDFNRADGSLGANWTAISDGGLSIASQAVLGSSNGLAGDIRTGETYTSDQSSQVEVSATQLTGGQWIGPAVRSQTGGQNTYLGIYFWNSGSPELRLYKRSAGTWIQLGNSYSSGPLAAGTQLKLTAVGSTISFLQNGIARITVSDSSFTGGAPAIISYGAATADNWTGGTATTAPDTTPPSAPGTLSASAASASEIDLSWAAASDNIAVTGYHIERCQGAGCNNFTEIGTSATTGYIDSSAAAGTSYSYRVRANDAAGNLGPYSNIATATTPAPATYSIGGTVSGLSGTVVLQNNGGNDLSVNSAGPFTFSTLLANGAAYSVTVKTNPSGQTCTASNASGTVTSANVTNIAVACTANSTTGGADDFNRADGSLGANWTAISDGGLSIASQAVLGSSNGLAGDIRTGETYTSDQSSQVEVSATQLTGGQWIGPAVRSQTGGQNTYLGIYFWNSGSPELRLYKRSAGTWIQLGNSYSSGPLAAGTQLKLTAVGSTISFLQNGIARITVSDSSFTGGAPAIISYGAATADNWTGNPTSPGTYSIGGTVSGLSGTVVLQNNGGNDLSVNSAGPFTFSTLLANGAAYNVTVKTNPSGQTCTASNASGTVTSANVTNIAIACTASATGFQIQYRSTDANGVASYDVTSADDGYGTQTLRVLAPTNPAPGVAHNFLYVLPVEAGLSTIYGDGLETLRTLNAQNQYNLTIIEPSFGIEPWYADNPTDPNVQYETFMTKDLLPWVEQNLALTGHEQNWLIGFSKSGIGGEDLILKHPDLFTLAASWDFPADMSTYDQYGSSSANSYGTNANFQANYRLTPAFVDAHKAAFLSSDRIWIGGYSAFQTDMSDYDTLLVSEGIAHATETPQSMVHRWDSGWVPIALAALRQDSISLPAAPP